MATDREIVSDVLETLGDWTVKTEVRQTGFTMWVKWEGRKPVTVETVRIAKLFEQAPELLELALNSLVAHGHSAGPDHRCETCDQWTAEQEAVA